MTTDPGFTHHAPGNQRQSGGSGRSSGGSGNKCNAAEGDKNEGPRGADLASVLSGDPQGFLSDIFQHSRPSPFQVASLEYGLRASGSAKAVRGIELGRHVTCDADSVQGSRTWRADAAGRGSLEAKGGCSDVEEAGATAAAGSEAACLPAAACRHPKPPPQILSLDLPRECTVGQPEAHASRGPLNSPQGRSTSRVELDLQEAALAAADVGAGATCIAGSTSTDAPRAWLADNQGSGQQPGVLEQQQARVHAHAQQQAVASCTLPADAPAHSTQGLRPDSRPLSASSASCRRISSASYSYLGPLHWEQSDVPSADMCR